MINERIIDFVRPASLHDTQLDVRDAARQEQPTDNGASMDPAAVLSLRQLEPPDILKWPDKRAHGTRWTIWQM